MTAKPIILLTNDDGIFAPGLQILYDSISTFGETWVVAPDKERSGAGHAITLTEPLRVQELDNYKMSNAFQCSGTPADCVKLAIQNILPHPPDMVISGINQGANSGSYVIYSGTVSAAVEGMISGIPSFAISLDSHNSPDFDFSGKIARNIAENIVRNGLPEKTILNVNIPSGDIDDIKGIKITKHGNSMFHDSYDKRLDPRNRHYFWMNGKRAVIDENDDVDNEALKQGYVSVTPLKFNFTDKDAMSIISKWDLNI
ncbi:MAG: 5'/3'-nucleotidase SurE [Candidatus Marinimicrobia bacterium]|nr:5'/3'-nucleotidase SurE [Candidatus Neomarinimicrobiota bacterium]MBT3634407.1 5'/3'-nucleotidase SurE [Candidatus Neomarinimicrobiota bacterium]MBT3683234.1 5'/3'-nucleotidase SurE [Candidatus Neomarinimicrobiota bacterium]MBT3760122.1 5'/3'-nucleotidase SurE [Candidatus Neomarinimicrobiota bacterium]MBT3896217.1 5'/3'-nucleotidase SurE [Candidatus Neomarinimicrobiota bacterium]